MFGERTILAPAVALALSLSFAMVSHATTSAYPEDFQVDSPNGAFRFEADFQKILVGRMPPDPPVVYKLIDTRSDTVVWSRTGTYRQDPSEDWPRNLRGAHVSDDGWTLGYISLRYPTFVAMSPKSGRIKHYLKPVFQKTDVALTSYAWQRHGYRTFITINGKSMFLIQTAWGERALLDPEHGSIITELSPDQTAAVESAERSFAMNILENACDRLDTTIDYEIIAKSLPAAPQSPQPPPPLLSEAYAIRTAIQMAGISNYPEAVPHLQQLEQWRPSIPDDLDIDPYQRFLLENHNLKLWRASRQALRRMGITPSDSQPIIFWRPVTLIHDALSNPLPQVTMTHPEAVRITTQLTEIIQPGMPLYEVFTILGAPDAESYRTRKYRQFEFDVDADPPFTFRIESATALVEREPPVVTSIDRITPPRWTIEAGRELDPDWRY